MCVSVYFYSYFLGVHKTAHIITWRCGLHCSFVVKDSLVFLFSLSYTSLSVGLVIKRCWYIVRVLYGQKKGLRRLCCAAFSTGYYSKLSALSSLLHSSREIESFRCDRVNSYATMLYGISLTESTIVFFFLQDFFLFFFSKLIVHFESGIINNRVLK